jgi:hypothetical protein
MIPERYPDSAPLERRSSKIFPTLEIASLKMQIFLLNSTQRPPIRRESSGRRIAIAPQWGAVARMEISKGECDGQRSSQRQQGSEEAQVR